MAMAEGFSNTPCAAVTFKVAVPVAEEPAEDVAVTVTVVGPVGAVNAPALVMLPPPLTLQVNVLAGALGWYAVNCTFPPMGTLADPGYTITAFCIGVVEFPDELLDEPL